MSREIMNSLEFIDTAIKGGEKDIAEFKKSIIENEKYPVFNAFNKEELKNKEFILKHFKQIKTELEAWEVVKKNIVIDITGSLYTIQIYKQDEECKTFEKALEVKDNGTTN